MNKKALLVVDVQNDFCPRGALPVPEGDKIIDALNQYLSFFQKNHWPVFASRDWHPQVTKHFKDRGGPWPVHCVQNTKGAQFHPGLKLPNGTVVLSKGMDPESHGYSAFEGRDAKKKSLEMYLNELEIEELWVAGLATDYCVKSSVVDACRRGLKVKLLIDAVRGVNLKPGDSKCAVEEMTKSGAQQAVLAELTST